jgi:hypothetical protein
MYRLLADAVMVLHLAFVAFAILGGLLALRWRWMPWLHAPAVVWGVAVELAGWRCPLTPLENSLRRAAGAAAYSGGFIEHYVHPLLYPATLTDSDQIVLGIGLVLLNVLAYGFVLWRVSREKRC